MEWTVCYLSKAALAQLDGSVSTLPKNLTDTLKTIFKSRLFAGGVAYRSLAGTFSAQFTKQLGLIVS